ncbi:peptidylprolyl isomerase [Amycolatopsis antarctica]|uniref:Peptidyl-prolyl cis-trans isomerase n=1 Tax=Amycolatopsis antarctica TaxID=1854586 RepID=A0A263CWA9_9PSEU|nr:peptidylprolyl isomerase [Amycolatopsis antarctica]OZM70430.1 peptidylprolyl isomerase [Amycolatopsis antarctica]
MKTRAAVVLAAITGMLLTGALPAGASPAGPSAVSPATGLPGLARCEYTPTPDLPAAKPVLRPLPIAPARGSATLRMSTNYGTVEMELDRKNAPCGVNNFVSLAVQRFYHHTQCFRLSDSARLGVLQCGDIYEVEKGGPGYRFDDEVTGAETYPRGTVAIGNQGPGTNGSQFFVVHSFANIDPKYTVLGRVTRGIEVLDRIVEAGIADGADDGAPAKPVRIHRVTYGW